MQLVKIMMALTWVSVINFSDVFLFVMKTNLKISLLLLILVSGSSAIAGGVYQQPDEFIREVYDNNPPKAEVLWLNAELKKQITDILNHKYKALRIRYWKQQQKSAWVLEEVGKEKPITTGIVVNNGKIERVKILIFRESRGWEVRHDFFTSQFKQAVLQDNHMLDKTIDNISGATLSVRAVKKLAQIALLLDREVQQKAAL